MSSIAKPRMHVLACSRSWWETNVQARSNGNTGHSGSVSGRTSSRVGMLDPNAANDPRKVLKQPRASGTPIWSPRFSAASANPMASSIRPEIAASVALRLRAPQRPRA